MINLENKVAVITGGGSGIGKALAILCLKKGMKVAVADIDKNALEDFKSEFAHYHRNFFISSVNVANEHDIQDLAAQTINAFGEVNFLFNNAGIPGALGPIWSQSTADIEHVLQVNLMGVIYGIKTFVPIMLKQNNDCHIINTSAGAGLLTGPGLSAYKASKHAIIALSEVLDADLKSLNASIHVSVLIPHWVNTNIPNNIITHDKSIIADGLARLREFGMAPELVAKKVFEGMDHNKFYIFTHPDEHLPKIRKRLEKILALQNP